MSLGPFDLTGGPFLTLYLCLFAIAVIVAGFVIPAKMRPEGRFGRAGHAARLAYLAGGPARFVDAVVTHMLATDTLRLSGKTLTPNTRATPRDDIERAVLRLPPESTLSAVHKALADQGKAMARELQGAGLLLEPDELLRLRFWQAMPYLLLLGFGAIKWEIGTLRDRPVGFLSALLVLTVIAAVMRFAIVDRRTGAGIALLEEARGASDRLRRAPTRVETGMAVALFGTTVLSGSAYADYHAMRAASGGSDGSSGGCGSDGGGCGGGGGGGGCGGCGS